MKLLPRPSSPTNSNMYRSPSETSASAATNTTAAHVKKWRFGKALSRIHSGSLRESKINTSDFDVESATPLSPAVTGTDAQAGVSAADDASYRQLRECVHKVKHAKSSSCDTFYKEYAKVRDQCNTICKSLLTQQAKTASSRLNRESTMESIDEDGPAPQSPAPAKTGTSVSGMTERFLGAPGMLRRGSSLDSPSIPCGLDQRSSFSGSSTPDPVKFLNGPALTSSVSAGAKDPASMAANVNVAWLAAIRGWNNCLEALSESLRKSLADTYKQYEANASQDRVDKLFNDKRFRRHAIESMRHASVYKMLSASPDFWPKYSIRFRNYEKVREDLLEIRALLQAGESGIAPDRMIREIAITPRGDTILEFSNTTAVDPQPVCRFRVSSHMLAETSPIFARMFTGNYDSFNLDDDEEDDIMNDLPPPPAEFVCKDGSKTKLFRMPQYEVNEKDSLSTLLHAAHIHNDKIPRDIPFTQFVAIANACLRYKCTSPLEMVVEHRWLPQWMHRASDEMPDGLLLVSFVFGLRTLFTRMTKTAIMNLTSEEVLQEKRWPQKIKDKIWAVRSAKIAQVQACCAYSVEEYIRPPAPSPSAAPNGLNGGSGGAVNDNEGLPLSSTPRCPKGSHWCDATNLGWMLLVYNEMQMLNTVMKPSILNQDAPRAPRSLSQMVNTLSKAGSAPLPVHTGAACDPAPAFRSAIHDIYNSVSGLTLYDISGSRHGWALSRHKADEPQVVLEQLLFDGDSPQSRKQLVGLWSMSETLQLRIFKEMDILEDLHAAARINKAWYETFKANELALMRAILRADRRRVATPAPKLSFTTAASAAAISHDNKVLKAHADAMKIGGNFNRSGSGRPSEDDFEEESIMIDEEEEDDDDDEIEVVFDYLSTATERTATSPPPAKHHHKGTPPPPSKYKSSKRPAFWDGYTGRGLEKPEVFNGMTREEAERILWPDDAPFSPPRAVSPPSQPSKSICPPHFPPTNRHDGIENTRENGDSSGGREKFRATDCEAMTELKSLAFIEDKKLRDEQDRKLRGKEKKPEVITAGGMNGTDPRGHRGKERVGRSEPPPHPQGHAQAQPSSPGRVVPPQRSDSARPTETGESSTPPWFRRSDTM
ncbi:hypothetical protein MKZ38_008908 [Zalerion maritima]|uniref:Uncharacterized protein n=1 Tax=Zalerion maritima TaxID=339359 RepID=A0AAD5RH00_9PEZI|nr:hypothetical protein MKZ38_008908 [Zalerion maritima]